MKLVVVFALFALAAARVDVSSFEPIHSGPEIVDIQPESNIGSIDRETLRAVLRKLLEILANLRPQGVHIGAEPVGFEPIHVGPAIVDEFEPIHVGPAIVDEFEPIHVGPAIIDEFKPIHIGPGLVDPSDPEATISSLEDLREFILRLLNRVWPDGINKPSVPEGTLQRVKVFLLNLLNHIRPEGVPEFQPGLILRVRDLIRTVIRQLWPDGIPIPSRPESIQDVFEKLLRAFNRLWPNGFPGFPVLTIDDVKTILIWVREVKDKWYPNGFPGLPEDFLETVRDFLRELLENSWPSDKPPPTLESLKELVRRLLDRFFPEGVPRPPFPWDQIYLNQLKNLIGKVLDRIPGNWPAPPGPGSTLKDLKDWIREIIKLLKREPVAEPPAAPVPPTPSSPLVQIIVNVKSPGSNVVAPPAQVEVEPSPVIIVEDAEEDVIDPVVVEEAEDGVIDPVIIESEPVIVVPGLAPPVVVAPDTLN